MQTFHWSIGGPASCECVLHDVSFDTKMSRVNVQCGCPMWMPSGCLTRHKDVMDDGESRSHAVK